MVNPQKDFLFKKGVKLDIDRMGGCCSPPEAVQRHERAPQRFNKCNTDVIFLLLFIVAQAFTIYLSVISWQRATPIYTSGSDSFGNICGYDNAGVKYFEMSDPTDHSIGYVNLVNQSSIPSIQYYMDHSENAMVFDSRISDIQAISEQDITGSVGLTYCSSTCPGDMLPEAVDNEDILKELAVQVAIATKNPFISKAIFSAGISNSGDISVEDADTVASQLWCEDFMNSNGYDTTELTEAKHFCEKNPVFLPSNYVLSRCVPNQKIIGVVVRYYTESQQENGGEPSSPAPESATPKNETLSFFDEKIANIRGALGTLKVEIILSAVVALVIAVLVILIIQLLTKYIVKILVIAFFLVSVGGIVYVWVSYYIKQKRMVEPYGAVNISSLLICDERARNTSDPEARFIFNSVCEEPAPDEDAFFTHQIITVVTTIVCVAICITICCCWGNIALAVELFDEAGQCIFSMLPILVQPLITIALSIVTYLVALYQILLCLQIKQRVFNEGGFTVRFEGITFAWEYSWLWMLFSGFWMAVFIEGVHLTTICGAVANWFFSEERKKISVCCPTWNVLCLICKWNLGSIALGALLIAVIKLIQVVIWIVERQAQIQTPPGVEPGKFKQALFACLKCCTACVEKFLAYINRNAYIGIAVFGYDFCRSAQKCMSLKVENAGRAATTAIICKGVLFLGVLIAIAGSVASFMGIASLNPKTELIDSLSIIVLYIIVGIFSWLITYIFISVYEMALDTIFICFCEDQQRNNGKDRPYCSSQRLLKFMRENA